MSARALSWCWQQTPASATEKLVLAALADRADDDGAAFPSIEWLALKCAPVSEQTVKRALASLVRQRLVSKSTRRRRLDGTLGTWLYLLPLDQGSPVTCGQTSAAGANQGSSVTSSPQVTSEPAYTTIRNVSTNVETAATVSTTDFVGFFVDEVRRVTGREPLANAKARIGRHAKQLIDQGVPAETVRSAVTEIVEAGLTVGAVLSVADQIHRGGYRGFKSDRPRAATPLHRCEDCDVSVPSVRRLAEHRYHLHDGPEPGHWKEAA